MGTPEGTRFYKIIFFVFDLIAFFCYVQEKAILLCVVLESVIII